MKRRRLGADGPEVGAIGLGAMSFAGFFGPTTEDDSFACMQAALDAGIDFWDTANVYGPHTSETVIGRFLRETGARVTLATKVGIVRGEDRFDNSRDHIRAELEGSLERLGRDRVELYYIHRRDRARPVEEVAETMGELIDEGLIGGWGLSEVAPGTLRRAHAVRPVTAVQSEYSLWTRLPDLGMIRSCAELGVAFVPFSPLARGFLTERSLVPADLSERDFRAAIPRFQEPDYSLNLPGREAFRAFAHARGWSLGAAALAWVLDRGPHMIPIPGTRTAAHLAEWQAADAITLTDEDRAEIDRILPPGWAFGDRYSDAQAARVERYC